MITTIETKNLTKKFGEVTAVDNISLNVKQGEIYGFLGLNGAGKTTAIRMLLGLIAPTTGSASILDKAINRGELGHGDKVGSLVEIPYSYPELTVRENLEIIRRIRGIKNQEVVAEIIDKLKLNAYANRKAAHLSLGNSQRLGIAKALMHNPEILILDEPSNGLDPAGIVEVRELLLDLAKNHCATIFISSHILGEIAKIADRIGILHNGKLIQEINADKLNHLIIKKLVIETKDNVKSCEILSSKGFCPDINAKGQVELSEKKAINNPEIISEILVSGAIPLISIFTFEEDLEAYFLRLIKQVDKNNE